MEAFLFLHGDCVAVINISENDVVPWTSRTGTGWYRYVPGAVCKRNIRINSNSNSVSHDATNVVFQRTTSLVDASRLADEVVP